MSHRRNTTTVPAVEQKVMTPVSALRSAVSLHNTADRTFFITDLLGLKRSQRENACGLFPRFQRRYRNQMTHSIFARDGTSRIVLKRESREAAEKKARELTDLGWFEVQIAEETQTEEIAALREAASRPS
jgi:hypothetical protein